MGSNPIKGGSGADVGSWLRRWLMAIFLFAEDPALPFKKPFGPVRYPADLEAAEENGCVEPCSRRASRDIKPDSDRLIGDIDRGLLLKHSADA